MALDESKDNDATYQENGITFLVDNGLLKTTGEIKIDYINDGYRSGFAISSAIPVGGGGCKSGCGSGSCG